MANKVSPKRPDKIAAASPNNSRNATGRWFELREQDESTLQGFIVLSTWGRYGHAVEAAEMLISQHPFKEISIIACDLVRVVENPITRTVK